MTEEKSTPTEEEAAPLEEVAPANPLEEKMAALQEQLLRTAAELENTRRRNERQLEDTAKYAVANMARDLVGIVDDFGRALHAIPEEQLQDPAVKTLHEGVKMTEKALLQLLHRSGVTEVAPKQGEMFDHNVHQAIAHVPSDQVTVGAILEVMQKGYRLHDRLLRPAIVSVAKAATANES